MALRKDKQQEEYTALEKVEEVINKSKKRKHVSFLYKRNTGHKIELEIAREGVKGLTVSDIIKISTILLKNDPHTHGSPSLTKRVDELQKVIKDLK